MCLLHSCYNYCIISFHEVFFSMIILSYHKLACVMLDKTSESESESVHTIVSIECRFNTK